MNEKQLRILMAFVGVFLTGISVALFKMAVLGTDPFTSFTTGLCNLSHQSYSTVYPIINIILFILILLLDRHYIGIATFINIFGIGFVVDFTMKILQSLIPSPSFAIRILFLLAGIVVMCFSASLYFTADLGVSTYDAVSLIMADKKIAPFRFCRIATDLICVIIGVLLGATVGIGTVITAFFMGPLIDFFNIKFSRPLLEKAK